MQPIGRLPALDGRPERRQREPRGEAADWLAVSRSTRRIDDPPRAFSGGMRQRLQIARNLVTGPRLVFMDEPTGGLDVSVQARLLDLLRGLVAELRLAAMIVTHDLAVARLLVAPHDGDEGRARRRERADRPGAGRPARALHPASRLLGPAGVSRCDATRPSSIQLAVSQDLHHASARRHASAGLAASPSTCGPANAPCSAVLPAPARARS